MEIVIWILIGLGSLVGGLLILGLFTKKGYALQREIVIDRPVAVVFGYIKHLKNQDHFNKWVQTDPNMTKTFRGTDGTVGFVYAWDGNKAAGAGEQEIMGMVEDKHLDLEVRFVRPFAAVAKTPFTTEALGEGKTKVTWGMSSAMKYPMNIMLLFMNMDKMLGKDLEVSMAKLKSLIEQQS
jgi:hypothetical protein